ncbi:MAG: hypothetical protein IJY06_01400 [Oscillospiraceae bacterium]|nr:hypothetical protein [Oscillospiraceae bacterium]
MKYYYVDYENVHEHGLKGIEQLSKDCHVFVYWHKGAAKPSTYEVEVKITYVYTQNPLKNAVDCKIVDSITDQLKIDSDSEYFIISKDKEYDKFIKAMGTEHNIKRIESIAASFRIPKNQQSNVGEKRNSIAMWQTDVLLDRAFGCQYRDKRYAIWNAVNTSDTQYEVACKLLAAFRSDTKYYYHDVKPIFVAIRPLIEDMPKQ